MRQNSILAKYPGASITTMILAQVIIAGLFLTAPNLLSALVYSLVIPFAYLICITLNLIAVSRVCRELESRGWTREWIETSDSFLRSVAFSSLFLLTCVALKRPLTSAIDNDPYGLFLLIKTYSKWFFDPRIQKPAIVVVVAAALPLTAGFLLFLIRYFFKAVYGFAEALLGIYIAIVKVFSGGEYVYSLSTESIVALLTASIFLIVRGFVNIHEGLTKAPKDLVALPLYLSLRRVFIPKKKRRWSDFGKPPRK